MGINPNSGDGVEKNYTVDGRTDATNIVSDAEHTGQEAGKAFAHIAAQADSANKGTSDLSKRVAALEKKDSLTAGAVDAVVRGTTANEDYQPCEDVVAPHDGWAYRTTRTLRPRPGLWRVELVQEADLNLYLYVANQSGPTIGGKTTQIVDFTGSETVITRRPAGAPAGKKFYVLFTRLTLPK